MGTFKIIWFSDQDEEKEVRNPWEIIKCTNVCLSPQKSWKAETEKTGPGNLSYFMSDSNQHVFSATQAGETQRGSTPRHIQIKLLESKTKRVA